MEKEKRAEAAEALEKLRNHPAINPEVMGDSLFDGMWFHMTKCCKRGQAECPVQEVTVYKGDKNWEKYKDIFDKEYKGEEYDELQSIHIPYEEFYGEPWVFDHVEYWYETTFFVFNGNPYNDEYMDYKNWARYGGPEGGADTFEDMLIQCWKEVKAVFGHFDKYKGFETEEEKANHEDHNMFVHEDESSSGSENMITSFPLERDPDYVDVDYGLINLRWLKWFVETDFCKKEWDHSIEEFQTAINKIKECETEARKKILEKYKK